jgi:hypothetical protein
MLALKPVACEAVGLGSGGTKIGGGTKVDGLHGKEDG